MAPGPPEPDMTRPALTLLLFPLLAAADWPTFLGPTQDGVSSEKGIIAPWPKEGLRKLWECPLGVGYPPPVIAGGKLYHFDRFGDTCRLTCREAATGKRVWEYEYPTQYEDFYGYDPGPRACPVVDGDRVYVIGPEGQLACVSAADGKERWRLDTRAKYHFHQNFFGVGSVPVVDGDTLIVAVGGSPKGPRPIDLREAKSDGTAVVGLDKLTGAERYKAGDELSSYSSPVVRTIDGKKTGLYFARGGLFAFDPQTGAKRFSFRWRAKIEESVNAANPLVVGDRVLLTECYGPGAALLDVKNGAVKTVWTDDDKDRFEKSLTAHWCTPIHVGGFVYGSSGRNDNDADVRCVELATGDVKWTLRRASRCSFTLVDGHMIGLGEFGELFLFKPNPARYEEVSRYRVPELSYPCWAPPVVSDGRLYVRGKERLLCLELMAKK
jgi:outer membrane protein assembly factor BamB